MKLDKDFARNLLLQIEDGHKLFETASAEVARSLGYVRKKPLSQGEADKLIEHLDWLKENGLIEIEMHSLAGFYHVKSLTRRGHEFLEHGQNQSETSTPPARQGGEIFTAKPAFMGFSVDLKELGRRVSSWWKNRR